MMKQPSLLLFKRIVQCQITSINPSMFSSDVPVNSTSLGSSDTKSIPVTDRRKTISIAHWNVSHGWQDSSRRHGGTADQTEAEWIIGKEAIYKENSSKPEVNTTNKDKSSSVPTLRAAYLSCKHLICLALRKCRCRNFRFNVHNWTTKGFLKRVLIQYISRAK